MSRGRAAVTDTVDASETVKTEQVEEKEQAEDDGWCGVCGSPHSEEGDALVFCDGDTCSVAVHQLCYGLNELPPENEPWLCEPCLEQSRNRRRLSAPVVHDATATDAPRTATVRQPSPCSVSKQCLAAGSADGKEDTYIDGADVPPPRAAPQTPEGETLKEDGGLAVEFPPMNEEADTQRRKCVICKMPDHPAIAMKRATLLERDKALQINTEERGPGTFINAWVHVTCALWIPEASFVDHDKLDVAVTGDLTKERGMLRCELCNARGQCVQCCKKRCAAAFHPLCILRELLGPRDWSTSASRWRKGSSHGLGEVLCSKHYEGADAIKTSRRKKGSRASVSMAAVPQVVRHKSEYEKEREARIARNTSFLASLGLADKSPLGSSTVNSSRKRRRDTDSSLTQLQPQRRSLRERTKNVNYADPAGGILGPRRTSEEVAKEKAEIEAKRRKRVLDAADRAAAQATVDDTRYFLRRLLQDRNEAFRVAERAKIQLEKLERRRIIEAHQIEQRRQTEIMLAEQRRIMEIHVAEQRRRFALQEVERLRQLEASEARRVAEIAARQLERAQREEEKRQRDLLRDIERAKKAVERALQVEKQREEKRLEKARKEDARAAARAAKDADLAEQKRAAAAMREGLAGARLREKRVKRAGRAVQAQPDIVASDAKIAELLLLEKAKTDNADGHTPKMRKRIPVPTTKAGAIKKKSKKASHAEAVPHNLSDVSQAEQAQLSATILAEGHRLPPCCFCGGRDDDPESATGAFIQQVFLWAPTTENPQGSLARAHVRCARLSREVTVDDHGVYYNVLVAAKRGAQNKCEVCGASGATVDCHATDCNTAYHAACAVATGWIFRGQRRFWCPSHRESCCELDRYGDRYRDASDSSRLDKVLLGCVSGSYCPACQKYDPHSEDVYVGCDSCRTWWHPACAGATNMDAINAADVWYCPTCLDESQKLMETELCICGAKSSDCLNEQMLLCETCDVWHHPKCVGLDAAEFSRLSASTVPWFCPKCSAKGRVCICQRPPKDGDVLVDCDRCKNSFHPECVGLEAGEAAAHNGDDKTRLFICPDCYGKEKEDRARKQKEAKRRRIERRECSESQQLQQNGVVRCHSNTLIPQKRERHVKDQSALHMLVNAEESAQNQLPRALTSHVAVSQNHRLVANGGVHQLERTMSPDADPNPASHEHLSRLVSAFSTSMNARMAPKRRSRLNETIQESASQPGATFSQSHSSYLSPALDVVPSQPYGHPSSDTPRSQLMHVQHDIGQIGMAPHTLSSTAPVYDNQPSQQLRRERSAPSRGHKQSTQYLQSPRPPIHLIDDSVTAAPIPCPDGFQYAIESPPGVASRIISHSPQLAFLPTRSDMHATSGMREVASTSAVGRLPLAIVRETTRKPVQATRGPQPRGVSRHQPNPNDVTGSSSHLQEHAYASGSHLQQSGMLGATLLASNSDMLPRQFVGSPAHHRVSRTPRRRHI